jgi:hypothetical protein
MRELRQMRELRRNCAELRELRRMRELRRNAPNAPKPHPLVLVKKIRKAKAAAIRSLQRTLDSYSNDLPMLAASSGRQ